MQGIWPTTRGSAVISDGSAVYRIQALWSAAHQKLPVIFVLANNGGYRILKQRLKLFHGNDRFIGMDLSEPPIDASGLARAFGMAAHRIDDATQFEARFAEALAGAAPVLLEVMVDRRV